MKNKEMFLAAIAIHGVDINACNTNELKELEKNILLNISGGYQEFHKGDTFSKEDYYKIDTPWGTIGEGERIRRF